MSTVRHAGRDDIPWVSLGGSAFSVPLHLRVLHVIPDSNYFVTHVQHPPGFTAQRHRHTGWASGYTLAGAWTYLEAPGYLSTAGSFIVEPALSCHTLHVPGTNTGMTESIFTINGSLLFLDDDGGIERAEDGMSTLQSYFEACEAAGLPRPNGILAP